MYRPQKILVKDKYYNTGIIIEMLKVTYRRYYNLLPSSAKLSQAQTEASVLAEISFNFVFTHPPHPHPGKVKKIKVVQNGVKWREN